MEAAYLFLIGLGWLFLLGWVVMLLWACAAAFRNEAKAGPAASTIAQRFKISR